MTENYSHTIDSITLAQLATGDETAYTKLVHIIYKKLFPFTVSLIKSEVEADDILQEVFLKIWLHRELFATIENPMGWIFRVVANTASNHLRSKIRREQRINQMSLQSISSEEIEEKIDARFVQSLVDEAVEHLPEKRKRVFLLCKRDGLSRKEVAAQLDISENTVRNQLSEAIKFIHEYLLQKGDPIMPYFFILQCFMLFFKTQ